MSPTLSAVVIIVGAEFLSFKSDLLIMIPLKVEFLSKVPDFGRIIFFFADNGLVSTFFGLAYLMLFESVALTYFYQQVF